MDSGDGKKLITQFFILTLRCLENNHVELSYVATHMALEVNI